MTSASGGIAIDLNYHRDSAKNKKEVWLNATVLLSSSKRTLETVRRNRIRLYH
jgi:hypothetical protein